MVPEPLSMYMGKKAIDVATSKVEQLLKEANDRNRSQIERCTSFLDACRATITGLEEEYTDILVQTVNCPNNAAAIRDLKERIDAYLSIDKLCTQLHDAITGLKSYQDVFEKDSTSLFRSPLRRTVKENAVKRYKDNLTLLDQYYNDLDNQLKFRRSGTGICQKELHKILTTIGVSTGRRMALKKLGDECLDRRDKEPMFEHVRRIREVTEQMRIAFM